MWRYDEGTAQYKGLGHSGVINCVRISPDQQTIVSVGELRPEHSSHLANEPGAAGRVALAHRWQWWAHAEWNGHAMLVQDRRVQS